MKAKSKNARYSNEITKKCTVNENEGKNARYSNTLSVLKLTLFVPVNTVSFSTGSFCFSGTLFTFTFLATRAPTIW
jgi:hypothetical protein